MAEIPQGGYNRGSNDTKSAFADWGHPPAHSGGAPARGKSRSRGFGARFRGNPRGDRE